MTRLFKVTGWKQYKTDCATPLERMQIAESAEQAIADATKFFSSTDGWVFKVTAEEVAR